MQIETERLILREMNEEDFDDLYCVLADSDIMQHYPYTFDEKRVRGWIEKNQERYQIFGFGLWAVCLKAAPEKWLRLKAGLLKYFAKRLEIRLEAKLVPYSKTYQKMTCKKEALRKRLDFYLVSDDLFL